MILGPSFWNAKFEGAKKVPPVWGVSEIASKRPVFMSASWRVEKEPGSSSMILRAGGGGSNRESTPWITPLVPNYACQ